MASASSRFAALLAVLLFVPVPPLQAGVVLVPYEAPEWRVSEWINADPGTLKDHSNRVVLIEFFQLGCAGSKSFSLPLFERWHSRYGPREDVLIVSIHSAFEGHADLTPERLRQFVEERGILHSVGIDAGASGKGEAPSTLRRFKAEGTPQTVIVDRRGLVRFRHLGSFDPAPVEAFIERLLEEPSSGPLRAGSRPAGRVDRELSGRYLLEFEQTLKSCGRKIRPVRSPVEVEVRGDKIHARFTRKFEGLDTLKVEFDPSSRRFHLRTTRRIEVAGGGVTLDLELEGKFLAEVRPPSFEFHVRMTKRGDAPGWECEVEGRGSGQR